MLPLTALEMFFRGKYRTWYNRETSSFGVYKPPINLKAATDTFLNADDSSVLDLDLKLSKQTKQNRTNNPVYNLYVYPFPPGVYVWTLNVIESISYPSIFTFNLISCCFLSFFLVSISCKIVSNCLISWPFFSYYRK